MARKISNQAELKAEISRLEIIIKNQESNLMAKAHAIRESFKPSNIIINGLASLTDIPMNKNQILKKGLLIALTYIFQRYFHRTEIKIETMISNIISEIKNKFQELFRSEDTPERQNPEQDQI